MHKKRVLLSVIAFCIFFGILWGLNYQPKLNISFVATTENEDLGQVFWANQEDEFNEDFTTQFNLNGGINTVEINKWIYSPYLRLDFGVNNKIVKISELRIKTMIPKIYAEISDVTFLNDGECMKMSENSFELHVTGLDPYLVFDISTQLNVMVEKIENLMNLCNIMIACLLAIIVYFQYEHMKILIRWTVDILRNIQLIFELAVSDFKSRYASSYLGMLWAFIQPVVTVLIYVIVFGYGFKTVPVRDFPFVLWLVAGIVPWFYFSEALTTSTNSLREYSYLVKKVIFEIKILPLVKITAAFIVHVFFVLVAILLYMINGYEPQIYYIQLIYYMFCVTVFVLGVSYLTSALNVFVPDLIQIINVFLQFGMWMTPIMWSSELFGSKIEKLIMINPLYYIVEGYRDCFYNQIPFWDKPGLTIYFWSVTILCLILGMYSFRKLEKHFADVL